MCVCMYECMCLLEGRHPADSLFCTSQNLSDQLRLLNRGRRVSVLIHAFIILKTACGKEASCVCPALIRYTVFLIQTLYCIRPDRPHYQPTIVVL